VKRWTAGAKAGLALILVAAAAVLVGRGLRQFVGYDAFWHVFIARQDSWGAFWQEVRHNAIPPLYYLLLKASLWLSGASPLAYRTVSIAATLASTLLLAGIVRRITGNQPLAVVGAAAFGLSLSATDIGLEARAYALGIAFLLVAFSAYLDWLGTPVAFVPSWKRAVFAGALTAALLTHYASFFFLAAALCRSPSCSHAATGAGAFGWRARSSADPRSSCSCSGSRRRLRPSSTRSTGGRRSISTATWRTSYTTTAASRRWRLWHGRRAALRSCSRPTSEAKGPRPRYSW